MFLHTDDFWRDYHVLRSRGIQFESEPRAEAYGTVAVFVDFYEWAQNQTIVQMRAYVLEKVVGDQAA